MNFSDKLEDCINDLSIVIDKRVAYQDTKSDIWLESDNGSDYCERTSRLEDVLDSLTDNLDELRDIFNQ